MALNSMRKAYPRDEVRELIEAREKAERDEISRLHQAREEGITQGLRDGQLEIAKRMLKLGQDPIFIAQATGLTPEEIASL